MEGMYKLHGQTSSVPAPTSLPPFFFFFKSFLWAHGHLAKEGKAWTWFIYGLHDRLTPTGSKQPLNYGPTHNEVVLKNRDEEKVSPWA